MKKVFLSILLAQLIISSHAFAGEILTVGVNGMVCSFCAQGIESQFNKQPEVNKVEVSLENKVVKIEFKEGKSLSKEKITTLLKDAGYEARFEEAK